MDCVQSSSSINSLILQLSLFDGLSSEEVEEMTVGARKIYAARGEVLFRKDEACSGLLVIIYGQVKLYFSSPLGNEKILDVFGQMQTLDESSLFQGKKHQVFAQALNKCMLLHITKAKVLDALENNQSFARQVIDNLSRSVSGLIQEVESYSMHSGRERVINYLAREALRANPPLPDLLQGRPQSNSPKARQTRLIIRLPTSKGVIASCLNLTQEHFSRILHELSACGLLSVAGREIHIENLPDFWQCACQIALQSEDEEKMTRELMARAAQPARPASLRLAS